MENMTGALAAVGGRRITIMKKIPEYFGCKVFDDREMKANLSAKVYQSLRKTIDEGAKLDITVANSVAAAMKDWAVAHGATHYTRSEERRVGKECLRLCRSRWSPYH